MHLILKQLLARVAAGRPTALCRLVATRGSTPQKAGALLLVHDDGSQTGTLGGGCVEAEVKRRALALLAEGTAEIVTFQLDSDFGWDDGLICGGRMTVLVDPLRSAADPACDYYRALAELAAAGAGGLEAIVFDAEQADSSATSGFLFDAAGHLAATLRVAPAAPPAVLAAIAAHETRMRPTASRGVAVLPCPLRRRLVIVGAGHVGQAVGQLAADCDFDICVVDDRSDYANSARFPRAAEILVGPFDDVLPRLSITPRDYCLIVTRGHQHDERALYHLADRGAAYVGMIGSRRKIKLILDDLAHEGISGEALARVFAPVGIDIGSQTVPEIAVSIVAELIAHRNSVGTQACGRRILSPTE